MICKKCGNLLSEDSLFCPRCGEKVSSEAPEALDNAGFFAAPGNVRDAQSASPVPSQRTVSREAASKLRISGSITGAESRAAAETPKAETTQQTFEGSLGSPAAASSSGPAAPKYCPNCGAEAEPGSKFCGACGAVMQETSAFKKLPIAKKKLLRIIAASAAAVCVVVCVILGISALTAKGPFNTLATALNNTLNASSFTAEISSYRHGSPKEPYCVEAALDLKHRDITALIHTDDGDTVALYNGYLLEEYGNIYKEDISDQLMQVFDIFDSCSNDDIDIGSFLTSVDPSGREWRQANEVLDLDVMNDCIKKLMKCLNDEDWLKENADYYVAESGSNTTYCFTISARTLTAVLDIYKPAFRSQADYVEAKYDTMNFVEDIGERAQFSFTTDGKYLTYISVTFGDYYQDVFIINFSQIGSTNIDVEQLAYWLSIAED